MTEEAEKDLLSPVKQRSPEFVKRVCDLLYYDPASNHLFWRTPRRGARKNGAAGSRRKDGYRVVRIDGTVYLGHYIAFTVQTGRWPKARIQFFDGNTDNWLPSNMSDTDWRNVFSHEELEAKGYYSIAPAEVARREAVHYARHIKSAIAGNRPGSRMRADIMKKPENREPQIHDTAINGSAALLAKAKSEWAQRIEQDISFARRLNNDNIGGYLKYCCDLDDVPESPAERLALAIALTEGPLA